MPLEHYKKHTLCAVIIIAILGALVYSNSLNNAFLYDDRDLIENNAYIRSWSHIVDIFTHDLGAGSGTEFGFYRPLQTLTYMIDYSLWGLDVRGFHATNIILHILVAFTIYWMLVLLFKDHLLALFTCVLYIVHPLHTESVTNMSGRSDSLYALFMLLTIIFYMKQTRIKNVASRILVGLCFSLSLLSKEIGLILPAILLLYHFVFRSRIKKSTFAMILLITAAYALLRITALRSFLLPPVSDSASLLQRMPGFFVAITDYCKLLCFPMHLHVEYGQKLFSFLSPKAIVGLVLLIAAIMLAVKTRGKKPLICFFTLWFFITLLPVSNTVYPISAYLREHFLYVPSIGFFLILAKYLTFLARSKRFKIIALVLLVTMVILYGRVTVRQNTYWKDSTTFYERALRYSPESPVLYNDLGVAYYENGRRADAAALFKKAISLNPRLADSFYNLALSYYEADKGDEAIDLLKKSVALNPRYAKAYCAIGSIYYKRGENKEAIAYYKKAIDVDPYHARAYYNLGNIYNNTERREEAITMFEKSIRLDPFHAQSYNNLGNALSALEDYDRALALYDRAIAIDPHYAEAFYNKGVIYVARNERPRAVEMFKRAAILQPDLADAYFNAGNMYTELGKYKEAVEAFQKTLAINPRDAEAYYNLGIVYGFLNNGEQAIVSYKKALEINENYAPAHNNLAVSYFNNQQYAMAIFHCDTARKLGFPVNPDFLASLKPYRE